MTRTVLAAAGFAALLVLPLTAYAVAAGSADPVATYTGCLKNGKLDSVASGDAPAAPCAAGATQVRLGGGDVTAVTAGPGLTGGGDNGDLTLAADPASVQTRVSGRCNGNRLDDASITAINQDGTVVCNTDDKGPSTDVFAGFYDGPVALPVVPNPADYQPVAKLSLAPGDYALLATLNVANGTSGNPDIINCKLTAGADFDIAAADLSPVVEGEFVVNDISRLTLQVVHEFADSGDAVVSCGASDPGELSFLKITATRLAHLSNQPLTLLP
jgi:hypothetical protein